MRDNLICAAVRLPPARLLRFRDDLELPGFRMLLSELPQGAHAVVKGLSAAPGVDPATLRRLGELGFIGGEAVQLLRRGPGGREPLAVLIGETMFALRALEAQCVEVDVDTGVRR